MDGGWVCAGLVIATRPRGEREAADGGGGGLGAGGHSSGGGVTHFMMYLARSTV